MFRFFERITEFIGWLQIAVSPSLIGVAVGVAVYFTHTTTLRLVIGSVVALAGILILSYFPTLIL